MVCVPCVLVPILLFLWKLIEPFVLRFWNPWKGVKAGEKKGITEEQGCPFGCPMKPKTKPELSDNKSEVGTNNEGEKEEKTSVNNKTEVTSDGQEDKKEK